MGITKPNARQSRQYRELEQKRRRLADELAEAKKLGNRDEIARASKELLAVQRDITKILGR